MPSSLSTKPFVIPKIRWSIELNLLLTRIPSHSDRHTVRTAVRVLQQGRCYWCRQPLIENVTTEHVVRHSSAAFAQLPPPVRWLTLRFSHQACNHAYNRWSQQHPATAATQDALLAQITRSKSQNHDRKWAYLRQTSSALPDLA